jgi:SAM-dependent methyltransferase
MHIELLKLLRCPQTRDRLRLEQPEYREGRIQAGYLVSENEQQHRYPIRQFIPRFCAQSNYADNFGLQWNKFRTTQLDSHSGQPISANRFWESTAWRPEDLAGQWVLDIGCGAGRFAEVALQAGANVVALDYSSAVDACYASLAHYPNLHAVQGDVYALPFLQGAFPYVYSLGVLQHTPDVARAFGALPRMLCAGGRLCVDFYGMGFGTLLHAKYALRPVTKHMSQQKLLHVLESTVPTMLSLSRGLGAIPMLGRYLKRLVPVANYAGTYALSGEQLREWALLDTFDMLAPEFDKPQTPTRVRRWFAAAGLADIQVFKSGHLVARGTRTR